MYTYGWPATNRVSLTNVVHAQQLHDDVVLADQQRKAVEHVLQRSSNVPPLQVVQVGDGSGRPLMPRRSVRICRICTACTMPC